MIIMLAGPSGIGKTTIAKKLASELNSEFISGSVSDLIPETKDMSHSDMISRDPKDLYLEDFKILNLRKKLFDRKSSCVSDRSFLDSSAYFIYKQSDKIPQCEVENFLSISGRLLTSHCDLLVVLELTPQDLRQWVTEDNDKRITNNYFQVMIGKLMRMSLDLHGYTHTNTISSIPTGILSRINLDYPIELGFIKNVYGRTRVMIIRDLDLNNRLLSIKYLCQRKW